MIQAVEVLKIFMGNEPTFEVRMEVIRMGIMSAFYELPADRIAVAWVVDQDSLVHKGQLRLLGRHVAHLHSEDASLHTCGQACVYQGALVQRALQRRPVWLPPAALL